MQENRRHFLQITAGGILVGASQFTASAICAKPAGLKALAFDAFPIFDPRPIGALAEKLFPGRGQVVMNAWRDRLFQYQWLRALSGQYVNFLETARDSLAFTAKQLQLDLPPATVDELMAAWTNLQVWPDAAEAVKALHEAGLRLVFLSNMTKPMLDNGLKAADLDGYFEAVISTDQIKSYKPDPRAYQLGIDTLGLKKEEILFVAYAGWDAAGAKWFGYPTFWVNRLKAPQEELSTQPDASGSDLAALVAFVEAQVAT